MNTYNAYATHTSCKTCKYRKSWTICQCCDGYIHHETNINNNHPELLAL